LKRVLRLLLLRWNEGTFEGLTSESDAIASGSSESGNLVILGIGGDFNSTDVFVWLFCLE
jgi:hypothetical protein